MITLDCQHFSIVQKGIGSLDFWAVSNPGILCQADSIITTNKYVWIEIADKLKVEFAVYGVLQFHYCTDATHFSV